MHDEGAQVWFCRAYGDDPDVVAAGALCFAAEPGERVCRTEDECARLVSGERQRVFRRINEMAAAGDPDGEYLAGEFARPDQLLTGEPPAEPGR